MKYFPDWVLDPDLKSQRYTPCGIYGAPNIQRGHLLTTALPDIPLGDIAYDIRMLRKHRNVRLSTTSPRLVARDFGFNQFRLACFVDAVECKNVVGKIDANSDNTHDVPHSQVLMKSRNSIMALLKPLAVTSPRLRDGEVPFIRWAFLFYAFSL